MTFDLVAIQNPWWQDPKSIEKDPHLTSVRGKSYFFRNPLVHELAFREGDIHILRGPRQVGKTTLLKQWIEKLLQERQWPAKNILYLSCEAVEKFSEITDLLTPWLKAHASQTSVIFLDEISFVKEWQRALLSVINAGLLRRACVVVTGSNARDLKQSSERFPGRRGKGLDISQYPLSPLELQSLRCFQALPTEHIAELYLKMGGFPHAIRDYVESGSISDETFRTYQNWILGDAARFELQEEFLKHLFYRIWETVSSRVTLSKIIETTPIKSHETALAYLEHLEDAFLTKGLYCYDFDKKIPALNKARKVYFIDPLLYTLAVGWRKGVSSLWNWGEKELQNPSYRGKIFESASISLAARKLKSVYFWYSTKNQKEVDLVLVRGDSEELYDCKLTSDSKTEGAQTVRVLRLEDLLEFEGKLRNLK